MSKKKEDNLADDLHTQLIKEFWMYSHWQERFERYGYKASAKEARNCLSRIKHLSTARYREIQGKVKELKGIQNQNRGPSTDEHDT